MIGKPAGNLDPRPELAQRTFEGLGHGDRADRTHPFVLQERQRLTLAGKDVFQMHRTMGALDNPRHRIVSADPPHQLLVRRTIALGQQDVLGAPQVLGRLAQGPARQQRAGAEWRAGVDQHDVRAVREIKVLHAVVEQQQIGVQMLDGKTPALHPVLVDQHRHPLKVARQHERFVSSVLGVQQQRLTGRHDLRHPLGRDRAVACIPPTLRPVKPTTLVPPRQDRHPPAPVAQRTGQQFDHRRLAGTAHRDVADRHHPRAQMVLRFPPAAVAPQAQLHQATKDPGQCPHQETHQGRPEPLGPAENHIRAPALEFLQELLHRLQPAWSAPVTTIKPQSPGSQRQVVTAATHSFVPANVGEVDH